MEIFKFERQHRPVYISLKSITAYGLDECDYKLDGTPIAATFWIQVGMINFNSYMTMDLAEKELDELNKRMLEYVIA